MSQQPKATVNSFASFADLLASHPQIGASVREHGVEVVSMEAPSASLKAVGDRAKARHEASSAATIDAPKAGKKGPHA